MICTPNLPRCRQTRLMTQERLIESPYVVGVLRQLIKHYMACDERMFLDLDGLGTLLGPSESGMYYINTHIYARKTKKEREIKREALKDKSWAVPYTDFLLVMGMI